MKGALPIFVINLDSSADRLAYQKRQFDRMGMEFERVPAIDGLALSRETYERYAFQWDRPISHTEVACLLSHSLCWRRAAEGNGAVVMEDDQVLADEIKPVLQELGPRDGALVFNLETQPRLRYVAREPSETVANVRFFELKMPTAGAGAYVVTRDAARLLLDRMERRAAIADYFIHSAPGIRRFQADPGLTLELRTMSGMYSLTRRPEANTVIRRINVKKSLVTRFFWAVQYPRVRMRRGISQLRLVFDKARVSFSSIRRKIEPSASILPNYRAMEALLDQKRAPIAEATTGRSLPMKLALVSDGNDFTIYDDAAWKEGKAKKLAMLNRNQADFTIEPSRGAPSSLPSGAFQTFNDALIALREAGFAFEQYEKQPWLN